MKRHISFGEIKQFRNVVRDLLQHAQYVGKDAKGLAIFDKSAELPKLRVYGTEKIHGTNAAVCFSYADGFWVQSRENIIILEKDNAGCAFTAYNNKDTWVSIIETLAVKNNIDLDTHIISVFYEWCGGSIQKKTAVSGLDKRAIIFREFKVSPIEGGDSIWLETGNIDYVDANIYNINNFKTYQFVIDFNMPNVNDIIDELPALEENSPVGEAMGIKGNIGEGIVITFWYDGGLYRFKVKGEKHANSRVKTHKKVDTVKEQKKVDFANYACTASRLEQAWQKTFGLENQEPDIKATGDFLRAVIKDVMKEEMDILVEQELEPKEVNGIISKVARRWFMEQLNTFDTTKFISKKNMLDTSLSLVNKLDTDIFL